MGEMACSKVWQPFTDASCSLFPLNGYNDVPQSFQ
jgi:hypothetical protein